MYERRDILNTDAMAIPTGFDAGGTRVALWQGDIATLRVGAIVNAGNDALLGCFQPSHVCVDNVIHSHAGPRLRSACHAIMRGERLPVGDVKVTPGFCLPCDNVLHTVGPQSAYKGHEQPEQLKRCYQNCLSVCADEGIRSVSFCCISTGLFGYPQEPAAKVALNAVTEWLAQKDNQGSIDLVVLNTFTDRDYEIYKQLFEIADFAVTE